MQVMFTSLPQVLTTNKADTGERKTMLPEEKDHSMDLNTLVNFEGVLQHSPMFYGFYSNRPSSDSGYRLPTAYFITGLVVYIYSFVATLRKYVSYLYLNYSMLNYNKYNNIINDAKFVFRNFQLCIFAAKRGFILKGVNFT